MKEFIGIQIDIIFIICYYSVITTIDCLIMFENCEAIMENIELEQYFYSRFDLQYSHSLPLRHIDENSR